MQVRQTEALVVGSDRASRDGPTIRAAGMGSVSCESRPLRGPQADRPATRRWSWGAARGGMSAQSTQRRLRRALVGPSGAGRGYGFRYRASGPLKRTTQPNTPVTRPPTASKSRPLGKNITETKIPRMFMMLACGGTVGVRRLRPERSPTATTKMNCLLFVSLLASVPVHHRP